MKRLFAVCQLLLLSILALAQVANVTVEQVGLTALQEPAIQKGLHLNAAQIQIIQWEFRQYTVVATPLLAKKDVKALAALQDRVSARILGLLTKPQRARFRQMVLQGEGIWIVLVPEMTRALNLTPAQVGQIRACQVALGAKIKALKDQRQKQVDAVPEPKDKNDKAQVEAYRQQIIALLKRIRPLDHSSLASWGKQAMADATRVLTPSQRAKWIAMQGPKFTPK